MAGFYVEAYKPTGRTADEYALVGTFDEAIAWIEYRLTSDPTKVARIRTSENPTIKQTEILHKWRVQYA